jgi:predicted nuclease of predicted toxin-antitoxin system
MARLYSNENFPFPVVEELRRLGHDVLTVQDTGKAKQNFSDEAVLAFATAENRSVLTINRKHFIRLHLRGSEHAGIVVCTFDPEFTQQARRIHQALLELKNPLTGQLIRVNRPQTRKELEKLPA